MPAGHNFSDGWNCTYAETAYFPQEKTDPVGSADCPDSSAFALLMLFFLDLALREPFSFWFHQARGEQC
jgi:hypothetical protein